MSMLSKGKGGKGRFEGLCDEIRKDFVSNRRLTNQDMNFLKKSTQEKIFLLFNTC